MGKLAALHCILLQVLSSHQILFEREIDMQELIVVILLGVVVLAAAVTYVVAGRKKSGMTR